ncbi:cache domain-containing protein [Shewanella putrefaciens]|uniref:Methyl-accepting chemotaxis protein n=1 Tax=Shewanella putrefaciens (strain 200) TaxID=399804 RepID=E6XLY1_SHEP2|nr:cache domain-containing protein [Shewanella putrefaciens]MDR6963776.1 hypothetical protein [Shewanella putrefaciens]
MKLAKILSAAALVLSSNFSFAEEVPQAVIDLADSLMPLGREVVLVNAVKAQNAQGKSLESIKTLDEKWIATEGIDDFMSSLMNNEAAKFLTTYEASKPYYQEIFLMDNQGANVAMTSKTSDYWQGDEDKWQKSFADGKGDKHIGPVKFDTSSQAYLVQISVPVMDGDTAIGAITIGINLDQFGL